MLGQAGPIFHPFEQLYESLNLNGTLPARHSSACSGFSATAHTGMMQLQSMCSDVFTTLGLSGGKEVSYAISWTQINRWKTKEDIIRER